MVNKLNCLRMLAIMLVFGMMAFGCSANNIDGTWTMIQEDGVENVLEVKFEKGVFEIMEKTEWPYHGNTQKGTFSIKGNTWTQTHTHLYGDFINSVFNTSKFDSKWYTRDEIASMLGEDLETFFRTYIYTFLIQGNQLTKTITSEDDGETYTLVFTRKYINTSSHGPDRIVGSWTGNIQGYVTTVVITDSDWIIAIPALRHSESGSYTRTGVTGILSSNRDVNYGTAEIVNNNTITIILNRNTDFPGTYTLTRQ